MPQQGSLGETFRILMDRQGCPLVDEQGRPQWVERPPPVVPVLVAVMSGLFIGLFLV